jgi:hypothetical protein
MGEYVRDRTPVDRERQALAGFDLGDDRGGRIA